jgi:conjugal transfer pilus assembly protein TraV
MQPVTPMLKPPRTVRTLILPYADRQRPDRLYMPRYVYSLMEKPVWVVGRSLVAPPEPGGKGTDPWNRSRTSTAATAAGDTPEAPITSATEPRR